MLSQFQAILVGGLCPGTDDPAECEANLPGFWAQIAALLWPGYWDPNVSRTIHSQSEFFNLSSQPGGVDVRPHLCST